MVEILFFDMKVEFVICHRDRVGSLGFDGQVRNDHAGRDSCSDGRPEILSTDKVYEKIGLKQVNPLVLAGKL
jgi:hypothetical protein